LNKHGWKREYDSVQTDDSNRPGIWWTRSPGVYLQGSFEDDFNGRISISIDTSMSFTGEWVGRNEILMMQHSKNMDFKVDNREDFRVQLPGILEIVPKVTPRHRPLLRSLGLIASGHKLTGRLPDGTSVTLILKRQETDYWLQLKVGDLNLSGIWLGSTVFY